MYAKYVVEGVLPNDEETENAVFQLMMTGLTGYLNPGKNSWWEIHRQEACSVLEYLTGLVFDKCFAIRSWDYNVEIWNWGNLNDYICARSV